MEITEEQIKEAHDAACSQWKQKIEQWFPECFKQKLEVGKWYQSKDSYAIYFIKEILNTENENRVKAYGFNNDGIWSENANRSYGRIAKCFRLATTEEVESMLIKEAEKRGFVKGVEYRSATYGNRAKLKDKLIYYSNSQQLTDGDGGSVYHNGKWATIVETPKEMTLEEIEKQLGHKVKIVS